MKNSKKINRIAALFICCVIMVGVFLPFFVYSVNFVSITISKNVSSSITIYTVYFDEDNVERHGYKYFDVNITSGTYSGIPVGDHDYFYAYGSVYDNRTGHFTYYRCKVNQIEGNTSSSSPNIVNTPLSMIIDYSISYSSSSNAFRYWKVVSGYTLTFDSQGGSSIAAENGVTDVILGDSTGYFPQYIPSRSGYEFLGWSLTPGGTYVREVHLDDDTTVYANWRINDGWCQVNFPDNSTIQLYLEGMIALPSHIAVRNMSNFSVYYYQPSSLANDSLFFDEWIVTEQLNETTVTEVLRASEFDSENDIYKLDLSVTGNDITVQPKIYTPYTCKLRWDSDIDQYLTVKDDLDVVFHNGDYITYYTYDGLDLTFNVQYPYLYCRMLLYQDIAGAPLVIDEYLNYYGYNDDNTNNTYNYKVHISAPENCVLLLNADAVDLDYDPNDPVVSFDSDGNAHWIVSAEYSFIDVDWDSVYSIIPSDFNGIMGTIFNLKGLAIIGSICFTAAFAIWFVRRSG